MSSAAAADFHRWDGRAPLDSAGSSTDVVSFMQHSIQEQHGTNQPRIADPSQVTDTQPFLCTNLRIFARNLLGNKPIIK